MRIINGNKVFFSTNDVRMFARTWPGCILQDRAYWFEFDGEGNLVDTNIPENEDGLEAIALADDAGQYMAGTRPRWATV